MVQSNLIIETLKKELKAQRKTYRDVARVLKISESSVKRLFAEHSFTLDRLERICELAGLEISELTIKAEQAAQKTTGLTLEQEQELVSDTKLLLMAFFLINRWTFMEIIESYDISETEGIRLLVRLDRMKLIQLLPGNRVKLMISNNFSWIKDGPIQRFYLERVQPDFLASRFDDHGQYRIFLASMLSERSNAELIRKLERVAGEFNDLGIEDQPLPLDKRIGTCLLIAMRPFAGGEEFARLRIRDAERFQMPGFPSN